MPPRVAVKWCKRGAAPAPGSGTDMEAPDPVWGQAGCPLAVPHIPGGAMLGAAPGRGLQVSKLHGHGAMTDPAPPNWGSGPHLWHPWDPLPTPCCGCEGKEGDAAESIACPAAVPPEQAPEGIMGVGMGAWTPVLALHAPRCWVLASTVQHAWPLPAGGRSTGTWQRGGHRRRWVGTFPGAGWGKPGEGHPGLSPTVGLTGSLGSPWGTWGPWSLLGAHRDPRVSDGLRPSAAPC